MLIDAPPVDTPNSLKLAVELPHQDLCRQASSSLAVEILLFQTYVGESAGSRSPSQVELFLLVFFVTFTLILTKPEIGWEIASTATIMTATVPDFCRFADKSTSLNPRSDRKTIMKNRPRTSQPD